MLKPTPQDCGSRTLAKIHTRMYIFKHAGRASMIETVKVRRVEKMADAQRRAR